MVLDDHPMFIKAFTGKNISFPERLTLEMTSYCNLKCWMCPKTAGFVNTPPNRLIDEGVIREVEKILPRIEVLQLSGLWGEVFLHPKVYLKILETAKKAGCSVSSISNGTLLTRGISERLVELGLDSLTISIDAATPKTYEQIRVGGKFKDLIKRIKTLQKIKRKKGSEVPVLQFAFVGMKRNIEELPELVRLASKLGVRTVVLQGMGEYEDTQGESLTYHNRVYGKEVYERARHLGEKIGVDVVLFPPDQFEEASIHLPPQRDDESVDIEIPEGYRKACDMPWKEVVVTTGGDVLPCCAASVSFGNILDASLEEIWLSKTYQDFRRKILSDNPPRMCKMCTGVGWRKVCEPGDYLQMGETDDQLGPGWYLLEENPVWERRYRWSKGFATFFLKDSGASRLEIEARIAGIPKRGKIYINDQEGVEFSLSVSSWETLSCELPENLDRSNGLLKVDLMVENPSREGADRRMLGLAVSGARLC